MRVASRMMTATMDETELDLLRTQIARIAAERDAAIAERDAAIAAAKSAKAKHEREVSRLQHKVDELLRQLYGRKSEKLNPAQTLLEFAAEEAKAQASIPTPPFVGEAPDGEDRSDDASKQSEKKKNKRKGHGWTKPPKDLPREKVVIEPDEDELECDRCGERRVSIGAPEITERYDFVPRSLFVVETIRPRYRCPCCLDGTVIAPLPPAPLRSETGEETRGRSEAGLLAQVVVAKFNDHLPLNRQHAMLVREGAHLSTSTLGDWVHGTADLLRPIAEAVRLDVLKRPVVGMDETGVRVVFDKHDPENGTRNARVWVYRGLSGEVYYTISETKSKDDVDGPKAVLAGYVGFVQADAAGSFDDLYKDGRIEVGCNAHARRKFFEAQKAHPKEAAFVIAVYKKVYEIEARIRDASPDERRAVRQKETKPILDALDSWLDELAASPALVPGTPLATAVGYSKNHRTALRRFLDDGRLSPDNNAVERSLRLVAVGRKNWLFAGSVEAAEDAATLYTLIAGCRELEIDPWEYMRDVIRRRAADPNAPVAELTPRAWWLARQTSSPATT